VVLKYHCEGGGPFTKYVMLVGVGGCLIRSHIVSQGGGGYHKRYHVTERRIEGNLSLPITKQDCAWYCLQICCVP
jgi:hypothetical protein